MLKHPIMNLRKYDPPSPVKIILPKKFIINRIIKGNRIPIIKYDKSLDTCNE